MRSLISICPICETEKVNASGEIPFTPEEIYNKSTIVVCDTCDSNIICEICGYRKGKHQYADLKCPHDNQRLIGCKEYTNTYFKGNPMRLKENNMALCNGSIVSERDTPLVDTKAILDKSPQQLVTEMKAILDLLNNQLAVLSSMKIEYTLELDGLNDRSQSVGIKNITQRLE
jgi:hypothetical protein